MQDPLQNRYPGGERQQRNRGDEQPDADRREHEAARDHDDALGARADPDVAAQPHRLGLRARVTHEERAGDRGECERERDGMVVPVEDQRDRAEHRALADPVCRRVEECAERRRLAARAGERAVEDVEDRAEDE